MKKWYFSGSSIAEYALPIALIAVVCVPMLTILATNAHSVLDLFTQRLSSHKISKHPSESEVLAENASSTAPIEVAETIPSAAASITVEPTAAITIPPFLSDTSSAIDSTGANGTTEQLATYLSSYIDEQVKAGKITQSEANVLQDLANQGHELANMQKALENAYVNKSSTVTYSGKTYSITAFGDSIGGETSSGMTMASISSSSSDKPGATLKAFLDKYNQTLGTQAMADPAISAEITSLASKILTISASLGNRASDPQFLTSKHMTLKKADGTVVFDSDMSTPAQRQLLLDKAVSGDFSVLHANDPPVAASTQTHVASGEICKAGKSVDTGKACK